MDTTTTLPDYLRLLKKENNIDLTGFRPTMMHVRRSMGTYTIHWDFGLQAFGVEANYPHPYLNAKAARQMASELLKAADIVEKLNALLKEPCPI